MVLWYQGLSRVVPDQCRYRSCAIRFSHYCESLYFAAETQEP